MGAGVSLLPSFASTVTALAQLDAGTRPAEQARPEFAVD